MTFEVKGGAPMPVRVPGMHLWVVSALWRAADPTAVRYVMDAANLITIGGPLCYWCERMYAPDVPPFCDGSEAPMPTSPPNDQPEGPRTEVVPVDAETFPEHAALAARRLANRVLAEPPASQIALSLVGLREDGPPDGVVVVARGRCGAELLTIIEERGERMGDAKLHRRLPPS